MISICATGQQETPDVKPSPPLNAAYPETRRPTIVIRGGILYRRGFLLCCIAFICLTAFFMVISVFSHSFTVWKMSGSLLNICVFGGAAVAGWVLFERGKYKEIGAITVGLSAIAMLLVVISQWQSFAEASGKVTSTSSIIAYAAACISLLLLLETDERVVKISLFSTIAAIVVAGILTIISTTSSTSWLYSLESPLRFLLVSQFTTVFWIIAVAGTIVTLLLKRMYNPATA